MSESLDFSLTRFQESFARGLTSAAPLPGLYSRPEFAVYRNTWRKALVDALSANYPVIAALVGPEALQALALQFIGKAAAPSPVLAEFGRGFADFIESHPIHEDLPYLADVARLERLATEAHLAPDAEPVDPAQFAAALQAGRRRRIALHPAARFAWFETPAVTIWEAHQAPSDFETFAPAWQPEGALVTRRDGRVAVEQIHISACRLLVGMQADTPFAAGREHDPDELSADLLQLARAGALTNRNKGGRQDGHLFS